MKRYNRKRRAGGNDNSKEADEEREGDEETLPTLNAGWEACTPSRETADYATERLVTRGV